MYEPSLPAEGRELAAWYFSALASRIRRFVEWSDLPDAPSPYSITLKGRVAIHAEGVTLKSVEDFIELG